MEGGGGIASNIDLIVQHHKASHWIMLNINHRATVFQEIVNLKACQAYFKVDLLKAVCRLC